MPNSVKYNRTESRRGTPARSGRSALVVMLVILYGSALGLSVYLAWRGYYELGVGGALLVLTLSPVAFGLALSGGNRHLAERVE